MSVALQMYDLCGPWRFQVDPGRAGDERYSQRSYNAAGWPEVSLPCTFDDCAPGMERYRGTCWFRREFELSEPVDGGRASLCFEAVNYNAAVWLNDRRIGENHDPFLPFEFDITDVISSQNSNLVAIRVDNTRNRGQFPLFEGWLGQGGVLREVSLKIATDIDLKSFCVVAELRGTDGWIESMATLTNHRRESAWISLRLNISQIDGGRILELDLGRFEIGGESTREILVKKSIGHVSPWSPESPALYQAQFELLNHGHILSQKDFRLGFRKLEIRKNRVFLNGTQIFLKGFNRHEDSPRTGMAMDLSMARRDFEHIKSLGANTVRLCHYPHHPGEIDICDDLGLIVISEIPLNGWGIADYPGGGLGWHVEDVPGIIDTGKRQLAKLVGRDMHHPSIAFWSVCNEPAEAAHPEIVESVRELIKYGKTLDDSRLWTHVSNNWCNFEQNNLFLEDDVICVNGYPSLTQRLGHHGSDLPAGTEYLDAETDFTYSKLYWAENLNRLATLYPDQPIMVTEFGYPSVQGTAGPLGEDIQVLATQAELQVLLSLEKNLLSGALLWCYAKHPWPPGGFKPFTFELSPYGYMSRDRKTSMKALQVIRDMFNDSGRPATSRLQVVKAL